MLTITLSKYLIGEFVLLPCPVHGTVMSHALTKSKDAYMCSCGSEIKIEIKEEKE